MAEGIQHFDFLVLGGGSAGYAAARTACDFCQRVGIVDGSEELGGLCILRGCMPSKTLIYSTEVLHLARSGGRFGLRIPEAGVDMRAMQERKRHWVKDFADYRRSQLESGRFALFRQEGRFVGPHEVELRDGTILSAGKIIVTTGSEVQVPPVPGLAESRAWTSDDILDLDELPESIIVLGGGIVACELGQFLARAGTRVTLIQRSPHVLKEASDQASMVILEAFRDEGIEVFTGTTMEGVETSDGKTRVRFIHRGQRVEREAGRLLNALGRRPRTGTLNLPAAGVRTGPNGHILHNPCQQTDNPDIYTAGDCAGPVELVHVAVRQGEAAARHAFGQTVAPMGYDALMVVIFTDPQVAWVGLREEEAKEKGFASVTAEYPFRDHGKSLLMEAPRGYVKLVAGESSQRILGAECVGKDASELIHAMTVPVCAGLTVSDCLRADWYHPTLAEIWTYPLEELAELPLTLPAACADGKEEEEAS